MNLQYTAALSCMSQRFYQALVRGANKQYFHQDVPTDLLTTNKQFGCLHCSQQVASTRKIWCHGVCNMMSSTILCCAIVPALREKKIHKIRNEYLI